MKHMLWISVILSSVITLCRGEAITVANSASFAVREYVNASPVVMKVVDLTTGPAELGLKAVPGFSVDQVTLELLGRVIKAYQANKDYYERNKARAEEDYKCESDGFIYDRLDSSKAGVHFYEAKPFCDLANTYAVPITATVGSQQLRFACSETPFQAAKMMVLFDTSVSDDFAQQYQDKTGRQVQQDPSTWVDRTAATKKLAVNKAFYKKWDDSSVWVMINLVLGKALQNRNTNSIQTLLKLSLTNQSWYVVEHTKNDERWGDGSAETADLVGPGENRLGLIWMSVLNVLNNQD